MPMPKLRPINWIQWLTLVLAAFTAATVPILWYRGQNALDQQHRQNAATAVIALQVRRALCLTKDDRIASLAATKAYLKEHPEGTPDFSREFILQSIRMDVAALKNLADVHCPT